MDIVNLDAMTRSGTIWYDLVLRSTRYQYYTNAYNIQE